MTVTVCMAARSGRGVEAEDGLREIFLPLIFLPLIFLPLIFLPLVFLPPFTTFEGSLERKVASMLRRANSQVLICIAACEMWWSLPALLYMRSRRLAPVPNSKPSALPVNIAGHYGRT